MATLPDLTKLTHEQLAALVMVQHAQINKPKGVSFRVSPKGGLSLYGLGQYPVTLYKSQWEKLLEHVDDIKRELEANKHKLSVKPAKE